MNIRQIQCLLEAGKELNFTAAAKNLFLTQPAVSRYITGLEQELGTRLFVRKGNRRVALTESGQIYYDFFLRSMSELRGVREKVRSLGKCLRLGYPAGWSVSSFLPVVLERCRQDSPALSVSLMCLEPQPLLQALLDDRLDAVLIPEDHITEVHADWGSQRITDIARVAAYAHRLLGHEARGLEDLSRHSFFVPDDERVQLLCRDILSACAPCRFTLKLVPGANTETVTACVENGLGAALLDEWCRVLAAPGVHSLELDSRRSVCLVWNAGADQPNVRALRNALLDCFAEK